MEHQEYNSLQDIRVSKRRMLLHATFSYVQSKILDDLVLGENGLIAGLFLNAAFLYLVANVLDFESLSSFINIHPILRIWTSDIWVFRLYGPFLAGPERNWISCNIIFQLYGLDFGYMDFF